MRKRGSEEQERLGEREGEGGQKGRREGRGGEGRGGKGWEGFIKAPGLSPAHTEYVNV